MEGLVATNQHFFKPTALPPLPWEMGFTDRKRQSKDPRMMKHTTDEAQWDATMMRDVWKRIRQHALPLSDWYMDPEQAAGLFRASGVSNEPLCRKLVAVFDPKETGTINGLVLCKQLQLGLQQEPYQNRLVSHCFNKFDRPPVADEIHLYPVFAVALQNPADAAVAKRGTKKSTLPLALVAGANYEQVSAFRVLTDALQTATPGVVTFGEFKAAFLDPENAFFVGTFIGGLFECAAALYTPPLGALPTVALRWLVTATPVPASTQLFDADVLLLREAEIAGGDAVVKKKAKKAKSSKGAK
jgi:hypothetical protein